MCKGKNCCGKTACPHVLAYHSDVVPTEPGCNDVLIHNCVTGKWGPGRVHISDVEGLDIDYDSLVEGDTYFYRWDGDNLVLIRANLEDLNDVDVAGLEVGNLLRWDGSHWVVYSLDSLVEDIIPGLQESLSLDDLSNVSTADSAATGSILQKTSGDWQVTTPAAMAGDISLNDLEDVSVPSPSTNQVLMWNGSSWVSGTIGSSNVTNSSSISGSTVTAALNNLGSRVTSLESSSGGGAAESIQMIRGKIGVSFPASGAGWSATRLGVGNYQVVWSGVTVPNGVTLLVTPGTSVTGALFGYSFSPGGTPSSSGFTIAVYRWDGDSWELDDVGVSFLAIWGS